MTNEENRDAPADRVQAWQAQTWISLARPAEWPRLEVALLHAELNYDDARYRAIEQQITTEWHAHRDDPLPEREARVLETEQGITWHAALPPIEFETSADYFALGLAYPVYRQIESGPFHL